MISGIGGSTNYFNSLFATNGTGGSGATSSLAQTEEKLFARIDSNGDGSLSQSEFTSHNNSNATSNTDSSSSTGHRRHHGHDGGGSLISQFMQQYQAAGATTATVSSTLSTTA